VKCEQHLIRPSGRLSFNSSDALMQAAIEGAGAAYLLDVFVNPHLASGQLVELFHDWNTSLRTFYLVTPKAHFVSPKIRALTDFLVKILDARRRPGVGTVATVRSGRRRSASTRTKSAKAVDQRADSLSEMP
jgi:LysR family transcriptional regulator for bpeEF and oprC